MSDNGDEGENVDEVDLPVVGTRGRRGPTLKTRAHRYTRLVHVYTSMICLLIVLFFSVTGLTLNHPTWTLGGSGSRSTVTGTLPTTWRTGTTIDWLTVTEYLRNHDDVHGSVSDHRSDDSQASVAFNGPGYAANAQIDVTTGSYELAVDRQGFIAVINDLHKGRDTKGSWKWLIDVSAVSLAMISATGLGLQLFLRKRRRSALVTAGVGVAILLGLVYVTTR
jgi:uncharacterized protein